MMTFEQFKTCVRSYFPRINISSTTRTIFLCPNDIELSGHDAFTLCRLCDEFKLPYDRKLIKFFWQSEPLVIGWNPTTYDDSHGYADYSYSFSGETLTLDNESTLLQLLKLAHDSNCFHYNKVK